MKKTVLLSIVFLFSAFSWAAETKVVSKIKAVTVFLTGAEVHRAASVNLKPGTQTLVLTGLSQYIDENTIQISGKGNFIIMGVDFRHNYLNTAQHSPEMKKLKDSLAFYRRQVEENTQLLDVYKNEKQMILANQTLAGEESTFEPSKLAELSAFYRSRIKDINLKTLSITRKNKRYNNRISTLSKQINELNYQGNKTTGEIIVTVSSKNTTPGKLHIRYKVSNAGWVPSYDIRSRSMNDKVEITYKASLYQNTGVDWKNVSVTFSTGNPNLSNQQPELSPWYLAYYNTYAKKRESAGQAQAGAYAGVLQLQSLEIATDSNYEVIESKSLSSFTQTVTNLVNTEFKIDIPLTVLSNGKEQLMELIRHQLNAAYSYYAVPKLDKNAFLLAKITGWEELSLLPGKVNLYNGETYVGKSYLDPSETQDTLSVSLGRDQSIVLERKISKDFSKNQVVGANRKITKAYDIVVRNPKSETIELVIVDQIPLSRNQSISVSADALSGGKLDEKTGLVTWKFTLPPKEAKKFTLKYTVKFPKDKRISNL